MDKKPTRNPDAPKAAHLPARDMDHRGESPRTDVPDLMVAGGEKRAPAAWVLRVCGVPAWGKRA
jgi:hypothetical protein